MAEIKDRVYLNGEWIDDYYLTSEKNQELKDLRKDLTQETQDRQNDISSQNITNENLKSSVLAEVDRAKGQEAALQQSIDANKTLINENKTAIEQEVTRAQDKETKLEQSISKEEKRANQQEKELASQIKNLETNVSETYETKADALTKKVELENTINDTKSSLQQEIKDSINAVMGEDVDEAYNTLKEISDWIKKDQSGISSLTNEITGIKEKNNSQDGEISGLETKVTKNAGDIKNLQDTVAALSPEVGGIQDLIDRVSTNETDINNLKSKDEELVAKDTALENKFNNYTTTSDLENQYVKKDGNKQLSTNDYTTAEKEKLAGLNVADYEKVINKSQEIDEDTTKYPSNKAVKDYVDNNRLSVDLSNYVVKEGESQLVNATTSFTNLVIQENNENAPKSVDLALDNKGFLNLGNKIKITNDESTKGTINYNGIDYSIFTLGDDVYSKQDTTIATLFAVSQLLPSSSPTTNDNSISSYNIISDTYAHLTQLVDTYIDEAVAQQKLQNPELDEEETKTTLKSILKILVLADTKVYSFTSGNWTGASVGIGQGLVNPYAIVYANVYFDSSIHYGFRAYGLNSDLSSNLTYVQIYPAVVDAYTKSESDSKYVAKSGYVAYTQDEKTKLNGIESGAQKNPASLKNPNKLTITVNGSTTEYDGSEVKSVSITVPAATTVENSLASTSTTSALSANQGKALNDLITNLTSKITALEEKVNQLSGQ